MAEVLLDCDFSEEIIHDVGGDFEIEFSTDVGVGVVDGPVIIRGCYRFTGTIPAGVTISVIEFQIDVKSSSGAGADSWYIGPYGTNGQSDPEPDDDHTAYTRCDVSSNAYLTTTAFRTTGQKLIDLAGTTSKAHIAAALAAGKFTIATRMVDEATAPTRIATLYKFDTGEGQLPKLRVVYTAAASSRGFAFWRWR